MNLEWNTLTSDFGLENYCINQDIDDCCVLTMTRLESANGTSSQCQQPGMSWCHVMILSFLTPSVRSVTLIISNILLRFAYFNRNSVSNSLFWSCSGVVERILQTTCPVRDRLVFGSHISWRIRLVES